MIIDHASAWVVAVDMGYGHWRAAYPLKEAAYQGIIIANHYRGIPPADQTIWENSRKFYEIVSRAKGWPWIGEKIFSAYDYLQRILPFYPRRDLSKSTLQLKEMYHLINDRHWGKDLVDYLNTQPLDLVTSFFLPAFFAEEHGFKGEIYCLICDADMSRTWAPLHPQKSRIKYLAPNKRVEERLKLYGVKADHIFLTGFPLPKENIGGATMPTLRADLGRRIYNLDPERVYHRKYEDSLHHYLGAKSLTNRPAHPLTLTFAVGGAGAQRDLAVTILTSLRTHLKKGLIKLNLAAGSRNDVYNHFKAAIQDLKLSGAVEHGFLSIIYQEQKEDYFRDFNATLRTTDILWTKPSELVFYSGLGLPIIMSPPIGSQEEFNKLWLKTTGAGITQNDPRYTHEWLFDWLKSGWLAEAAMDGFLDAPKFGTYNIERIIEHRHRRLETPLQLL